MSFPLLGYMYSNYQTKAKKKTIQKSERNMAPGRENIKSMA